MDLDDLTRWIPAVERTLKSTYRSERRRVAPEFRTQVKLLERFALRGGKRFRALMVLAGYHLATRRPPTAALPAAAAMEHFQSWMLIHDDIIDHAEVRRGGPTVHRALERELRARRSLGDPASLGVGLGITLGDLEEPFTVAGLIDCPVPVARRLRALRQYVQMTRLTAYGQVLDILNGARPVGDIAESDVLWVHRLKSAIYTVANPLKIGATLGGGSDGLLEELEHFGGDIGVAFQLRDDILGTGFDSGAAGKSANDLIEGKRTLLVVKAWEGTDATGRAVLAGVLGNSSASPAKVERARRVIEESGSLRYSETLIRRLSERAYRRVRASRRVSTAGKGLLLQVGDRLVHRAS
ncbi:MAG: polyprenyl synthetase family protein [Thermoplasmata archaeon]|nr:polyprenyl synthetase family protein [Thermoplasmata archaeon]MCI4359380.1 polyprenyl synthetase family protein [Thermoplasmata archaeon]